LERQASAAYGQCENREKLLLIRHRLVIKGQPDEEAVLCTQHKTYALKQVSIPPLWQLHTVVIISVH